MNEKDYILATDKRALDCALACLQQITPENNPMIAATVEGCLRELTTARDALTTQITKR